MFLAIKEMLHEKLRYSLIVALIFLVSYLLIILTGLANLNKAAINEWDASSIVLNSDSEGRLQQSFLSQDEVASLPNNGTRISQYSTLVKSENGLKENTQLVGLDSKSFIFKKLKITSGSKNIRNNAGVVSDKFKSDGFKIGDHLLVADSSLRIKITGFTPRATLSALPVVYISPDTIQPLNKGVTNAVVFKNKLKNSKIPKGTNQLSISSFIKKLPGYSAQQLTFNFMIAFLYIIILIVISIFLYILTVQKLPNLGVLKAQGVSTQYLILSTLFQSFIISVIGVIIAIILGEITAITLPSEVPIVIDKSNIIVTGIGIIIMSLLGALIPIRQIAKVDPYKIIGG